MQTVLATPGVRLTWVASRNPETRVRVPVGTIVVEDWRALPDAALDGVVVASPASLHGVMLRLAIESGVPVFVEKPLTLDLREARGLAALAEARDALVLVDHTHLFQPGYEALRRLVADHGGPRAIRSEGGQYGRREGDAGALWEYGSHDVALCLDLVGPGAMVERAERLSLEPLAEGPGENLRLALRWPEALGRSEVVRAEITVGNLMREKRRRFIVECRGAAFLLDNLAPEPLLQLHGQDARGWYSETRGEPISTARDLPLDRAMRRFAAGIRGDRAGHPEFGLTLAVDVVRVLTAAEAALLAPPGGPGA